MSKITNKPTKTDETTLALRGLCAKRASTICYMIQQAKEHGVQDGAAFAREAITKYGEDIGQVVKSKMKDPDDLLEFSQYFGAGADRDIYEMEVVAQDEDRFYLDFHYCPYVAEWQKMGRDPEEKLAIDFDPGASEVNQLNRIKLMLSTAQKNLANNS